MPSAPTYCRTKSALPSPFTSATAATAMLGTLEEVQSPENAKLEPVDNRTCQRRRPALSYCNTRSALPSPSTSATAGTTAASSLVDVQSPDTSKLEPVDSR